MSSVAPSTGRENLQSCPVDLSPAVTTVAFDPILPLLRVPVPAGKGDDPSKGAYVLAFKDEESWHHAWHKCEEKVFGQCEAGARMGCSISAANACRPPWWKAYFPFLKSRMDEGSDREACEEREMRACLAASKERCTKYAQDTCEPVFAEMRIAAPGQSIDPWFTGKQLQRRRITRHDKKRITKAAEKRSIAKQAEQAQSSMCDTISRGNKTVFQSASKDVTNFHGRKLMGEGGRRLWKLPVCSNEDIYAEVNMTPEPAAIEGWVGGLVRPKLDYKNLDLGISDHPEPVMEPRNEFWHDLQCFFREKFKL